MRKLRALQIGADDGLGRVYRAQTREEPAKLVAVKKCHVTDYVEHPRLIHEACALILLRGMCDAFFARWHAIITLPVLYQVIKVFL